MVMKQIFYQEPVPVTRKRHERVCVDTQYGFEFASHTNAVPLVAQEFSAACHEFPIVFVKAGQGVLPFAILGIREDTNQFVSATGEWIGNYIPRFVARYPFVFLHNEQTRQYTLCIDEKAAEVNENGVGKPLFDKEGETEYLRDALDFLKTYQRDFQITNKFCEQIRNMDLLTSMDSLVERASGSRIKIANSFCVDRDKLKSLESGKLQALAKTNELELIYAHLLSLENIRQLVANKKRGNGTA